jgi:hypothetical protein
VNVLDNLENRRTDRARLLVGAAVACVGLLTGCGSTVQYAGSGQELGGLAAPPGSTGTVDPGTQGPVPPGGRASARSKPGASVAGQPGSWTDTTNPVGPAPLPTDGPVKRTPIKIGFLTVDYAKAYSNVGLSSGAAFDWEANYRALITGLNKRGGIGGRIIKPFFYSIDGTSSSYTLAAQEACTALTQDDHVELVLTYSTEVDSLTKCFSDAGVPQIDGNPGVREDTAELRKSPDLISPEAIPVDKYAPALINGAFERGWLTPKNRLGVFIEGCPANTNAYDHVVEPMARRLGVGIEKFTASCIRGFGDVGQVVSAIQAAALQFHSNGVDRVMYLSAAEAGINGLFAKNADSQKWYPTYLLSTNAKVVHNAQNDSIPATQLPNMRGLGWAPGWDTDNPAWSKAQLALQGTCRALAHAGGVAFPAPRGMEANQNPYIECDTLLLLAKVLGVSRGATKFATVMGAVDQLGGSYLSPMTLDGVTQLAHGRHMGAQDGALFSYKTSCKCFTYDTAPSPIG